MPTHFGWTLARSEGQNRSQAEAYENRQQQRFLHYEDLELEQEEGEAD